jgi:putative redox protein
MSVEISIVYQGILRCDAVHGPSSIHLLTDAPLDNHGKGESFSPTDLVATALGTCMMTIMAMAAKSRGIDLGGSRVRVEKHMVKDPERRIGALPVVIRLPVSVGESDREALELAARTCPVMLSLDPRIEKNVQFHWGERARV